MSEHDDVAAVLADAVLLDGSPQADALGEAVAAHLSHREPHNYPPPSIEQVERWFASLDELHRRRIALPIDIASSIKRMRDEHDARKERADD